MWCQIIFRTCHLWQNLMEKSLDISYFPGFCPRRLFSQAYRCYDADNGNSKGSLEGIQGYVVYDMYYNA